MLTLVCLASGAADKKKVKIGGGADIVSSYIWRGSFNAGASVQPTVEMNVAGFTLSAWGSVDFGGNGKKRPTWLSNTPTKGSPSVSPTTGGRARVRSTISTTLQALQLTFLRVACRISCRLKNFRSSCRGTHFLRGPMSMPPASATTQPISSSATRLPLARWR